MSLVTAAMLYLSRSDRHSAEHQRGFAGAHGAADSDPERHDLNSLEYWVSCFEERIAKPGAETAEVFVAQRQPHRSRRQVSGSGEREAFVDRRSGRGELPSPPAIT